MKSFFKWLCVCFLVLIPTILLGSRLALLTNTNEVTTHIVERGADIRFYSDRAYVPFFGSCVLAGWQVEGIQAVHINGAPTIGVDQRQVCGEAPRLWITFQDGSEWVYRIERNIAFTPEYRLLAFIVPVGLVLFLRLTSVRVRFGPSARWRARLSETRLARAARALSQRIHEMRVREPAHFYALLAIILVGVLLRFLFLSQPMKGDESVTFLNRASRPLGYALSTYDSPNNHLFHTLLVSVSYSLFGNAPWVIRLPVFFAGILTIPATYVTTRLLYNRLSALLSAAIIATLPEMIFFSTNARGYMLICLFFMLLLGLGKYLVTRRGLVGWSAYAALMALGFYTLPTMLYAFGILNVWLLISILIENPREARLPMLRLFVLSNLAAGFLTMALYLPVFMNVGIEAITANKYVQGLPWVAFVEGMQALWPYLWEQWTTGLPGVLVVLLVVGFGVSVLFHRRLANHRTPLTPLILGVMAVIFLMQQNVPFARSLLFLLPVCVMIACAGVIYLVERLLSGRQLSAALTTGIALVMAGYLGVNVVVTQSVYYFEETAAMREAQDVAVYLETQLRPKDSLISPLGIAILEYYWLLRDFRADGVYLRRNDDDVTRVFTLVNRAGLSLPQVLERYGFTPGELAAPTLLRQFESYDLYLVNKR